MAEFFCMKKKTAKGFALIPAHQTDEESVAALPNEVPLRVKVTRMRNVDHHRKYFALLNYAYDCWEPLAPIIEHEWQELAQKNFDRFRKDIAILCGFYEASYRLNGECRLEAKSISFANMDQDEFEKLYDKTIDVIVKHVLTNYTGDELRNVVDQVMEFA